MLSISAIPDQDPSELVAREQRLADYLAETLDVEVEYVPVTDYAASVQLFTAGDLDLVFYGGLTGVQAGSRRPAPRSSPSATSTRSSAASSSPGPGPGSTRSSRRGGSRR